MSSENDRFNGYFPNGKTSNGHHPLPINGEASKAKDYSEQMKLVEDMSEMTQQTLRNLDLFVLDNSLRESTVGQLKGHTVQDKMNILHEVKECNFKHIIISAFSNEPRVDDEFVKELNKIDDFHCYYAFTDLKNKDSREDLPYGLQKIMKYKLKNPIFEIDLAQSIEDAAFTQDMCLLLEKRINFTYENLSKSSRILINLRDMPFAMRDCPTRVIEIIKFLGGLPEGKRPFGLMYEDPSGKFLPQQLGGWTEVLRMAMDDSGWKEGHLLVHIHKKWGYADATQIECLSRGANGIWASVCEEGAAIGHASSIVTIMNLIRHGNKKVTSRYNCEYLREAAIRITESTTGEAPHPKQLIYGDRALDLVFGFKHVAGGPVSPGEFDTAKFFGFEYSVRINNLSSEKDILEWLEKQFGESKEFTIEMARRMKIQMKIDQIEMKCKEEYMSRAGLALLFKRAGGTLTPAIEDEVTKIEPKLNSHKQLLKRIKAMWDDVCPDERSTESLDYFHFYHRFMAPYFSCYKCCKTEKALKELNLKHDNKVHWGEFSFYLKWALREYGDPKDERELLKTAFLKGLIPAMHQKL